MDDRQAIRHATEYRTMSAAMRALDYTFKVLPLDWKARICHRLYEEGHKHWLALWNLPLDQYARAFDASRRLYPHMRDHF